MPSLLCRAQHLTADTPVPADACALFGPDPPPGGLRPRDPDTTGGYYQPIRAIGPEGETAFGLERIECSASNISADIAAAYAMQYKANNNPKIQALTATSEGAPLDLGHVPAGARIELTASWTSADAETFVVVDVATQTLVSQREGMRVSWFTTGGTFDEDRTGRDGTDPATTTTNGWTAPGSGEVVHLWLVCATAAGASISERTRPR